MTPLEWLDAESGIKRNPGHPDYLTTKPTNLEFLAELIYVNGGSVDPKEPRPQAINQGPYLRMNLTFPGEFVKLTEMWGILSGVLLGSGGSEAMKEAIQIKIQNEINRVKILYDATEVKQRISRKPIIPTPEEVFEYGR